MYVSVSILNFLKSVGKKRCERINGKIPNGAGNILSPQPCLPHKDFMKLWMICILTGHSPCKDIYKGHHTHHSLLLHLETPDLNWKKSDSFSQDF